MKKNYLLIVLCAMVLMPFVANAQNLVFNGDLEQWDDANTPTGWDLMDNISQEATTIHGGTYSAAQMSASSSQKFRQDIGGIVGGQQYTISYFFLDNVDNAKTRVWSYWMDDTGGYLDDDADVLRPDVYSENNADWQGFNELLTAPANATQFRFEVRTYHQDNNVDGYIYFDDFSMEGTSTNYPEPTNYPTDFTATAVALSIGVEWTDAVGDQLPGAYLLLGQKGTSGSFTAPVDGTPVADDMDWSDGSVSVNVSYAEEMYSFSGLESGEAYEFTIYPYTNAADNIDYKTDGDPPYATAEVSSLTVIHSESFDATLGAWMGYTVTGTQVWEWADYGDPPGCAKMTGFENSTSYENEDWLISPALNLTGYESVLFGFDHARNYGFNEQLYVLVSNDYDGESDPSTNGTWVDITDGFYFPESGSWDFVDAGENEIASYGGENTYLAFKYTSTDSETATWEIDNILLIGEAGVGLIDNKSEQLSYYPNPASDVVNFRNLKSGEIRIVSLTGQVVAETMTSEGDVAIDISNLKNGLYLVQFIDSKNKVITGKLMVR